MWTILKTNAWKIKAFLNPYWFFNSSKSQPLKTSSSAKPTPIIKRREFNNISGDVLPNQLPHWLIKIGINIRNNKMVYL